MGMRGPRQTSIRRSLVVRSSAVADNTKHNVSEMGMFFLDKPTMKASDIFPNGLIQAVCADFACKGRECTRENCAFVHPRKVGDLKKETINAIGKHFLTRRWLVQRVAFLEGPA